MFVTLIITFHFILGSFLVLALFGFVALRPTKGDLEFLKIITDTLKVIFEYDFYIIISGLSFIAVKDVGQAIVAKAQAKAQGPADTIIQDEATNNIETANINPNTNQA